VMLCEAALRAPHHPGPEPEIYRDPHNFSYFKE
jgi:hypothetical protein